MNLTNPNWAKLTAASNIMFAPLLIDNIANPPEAVIRAHGYLPFRDEPPTPPSGYHAVPTIKGEVRNGIVYRTYTIEEDERVVHRYSKLKLITAAKSEGVWDALKEWIEDNDYSDEWAACMYLSDDYTGFDQIVAAVVAAGVATQEQIAAILAAAEDETLTEA